MRRAAVAACVAVLSMAVALADPYWITYEGDVFPEDDGWSRIAYSTPGSRWLENGSLFLDSRADTLTYDYYVRIPDGQDPRSGESFVMDWSVTAIESIGQFDRDISVVATFQDGWAAGFLLNETSLESAYEVDRVISFEPGVRHDFRFTSDDIRRYRLFVDGQLAMSGELFHGTLPRRVSWGDGGQGSRSFSQWDYVRFGVVPEPSTAVTSIFLFVGVAAMRINDRPCLACFKGHRRRAL